MDTQNQLKKKKKLQYESHNNVWPLSTSKNWREQSSVWSVPHRTRIAASQSLRGKEHLCTIGSWKGEALQGK